MAKELVYVGSYTKDSDGKGIYIYEWDSTSEKLNLLGVEEHCDNPSFLAFHPDGRHVYAANELPQGGYISAYEKLDTGLLRYLGKTEVAGSALCHVAVTPAGNAVCGADYGEGNVMSCGVTDGDIGPILTQICHKGGSVHPRQEGPHAHQIAFTPDGKKMIAVDLGTDKLMVYSLNPDGSFATAGFPVDTPPGEGPRHLVFHPNGRWLYVLTEIANNVLRYDYDSASGAFTFAESVSTLPEGHTEFAFAAELALSADSRFLYASVRAYDRIVRFSIDGEGRLFDPTPFPCGGQEPRMFSLDGENRHVFVANQRSNKLSVLRMDPATGDIGPIVAEEDIPVACYAQWIKG
ncbi:MAG: lactonase family protein [Oscillospiraceae bacterium]